MDLIEYCQSNPKLELLDMTEKELYEKLTDIVPYCSELQELSFRVKGVFNDSEYTGIANLTKLRQIHIKGEHEKGSLKSLFNAFAKNQNEVLENIIISDAAMDYEEIADVLKIKSLKKFTFNGIEDITIIFDPIKFNLDAGLTLCFVQETDASILAELVNVIKIVSLVTVGIHRRGTLKTLFGAIAAQDSPNLKIFRSTSCESYNNNIACKFKVTILTNEELLELLKIKSLDVLDCHVDDSQPIELPSQVPQLTELAVLTSNSGCLVNLFRAFSMQNCSKLTMLSLRGFPLSTEEFLEISKIIPLTCLTCGFADITCIDCLVQLKKLELLDIISYHEIPDISEGISKLAGAFNGNLSICYKDDLISYDKHLRALTIKMSSSTYSSDFAPLANLPNLPILLIYGEHRPYGLAPLLKAFAKNQATTLQEVCIKVGPICYDEVAQIAEIKTLRYLESEFSDSHSIKLLEHLPKLETLRICSDHQMDAIGEGVLQILQAAANEVNVIRSARKITFNKQLCKLTIANDSYDNTVHGGQEYAVLAELPQVHILHIRGDHEIGSFQALFQALAAKEDSALRELSVDKKCDFRGPPTQTINFEETAEVAKIRSLKRLKCGFVDDKSIALLAELAELEELEITTHPEGSLTQFLYAIAQGESSNLHCLAIKDKPFTSEEAAQVTKINSITTLECGFRNGQDMELLSQSSDLAELTITSHDGGSFEKVFAKLAAEGSKSLRYLNIENIPMSYKDTLALVEIQTLSALHCTLDDTKSLELLSKLPQLEELSVKCNQRGTEGFTALKKISKLTDLRIASQKVGSLSELFQQLSLKAILEHLAIYDNDVDLIEVREIKKLHKLQSLKCGFSLETFAHFADLKNLEVLEITSYHNIDDISSHLLEILKVCDKLKAINFYLSTRFVSLKFYAEAFAILKAVRNPQEQNALQLCIPEFGGLTPEQIAMDADAYLRISVFKADK